MGLIAIHSIFGQLRVSLRERMQTQYICKEPSGQLICPTIHMQGERRTWVSAQIGPALLDVSLGQTRKDSAPVAKRNGPEECPDTGHLRRGTLLPTALLTLMRLDTSRALPCLNPTGALGGTSLHLPVHWGKSQLTEDNDLRRACSWYVDILQWNPRLSGTRHTCLPPTRPPFLPERNNKMIRCSEARVTF